MAEKSNALQYVVYAVIGLFACLIILRSPIGAKFIMPLLKSEKKEVEKNTVTKKEEISLYDYLKPGIQPCDFTFLKEIEQQSYPTLREALAKRHVNAKITLYDKNTMRFQYPVVLDDFFGRDGNPVKILTEYQYKYSSYDSEDAYGIVNYCANVSKREDGVYLLTLERRENNVPNCIFDNEDEKFVYTFIPSKNELGRSKNRIETIIDNNLRNKDLSEMTQEEIEAFENQY